MQSLQAEQSLLAAFRQHQVLNFYELPRPGFGFPRGFPQFPPFPLSPHGSWTRSSLAVRFTRAQLRMDSGMSTTPANHRPLAEPPGRRPPAPGPQHYRVVRAGRELLRSLFSSRFPGSVEPRHAVNSGVTPGGSGLSTTPARCGRAEPPDRRPPASGPQQFRVFQAGWRVSSKLLA